MFTTSKLFEPTERQLKQFALILPLAIGLTGWLTGVPSLPTSLAAIAAATLALVGQRQPLVVRPVFITATLIALPFGLVLREVVLLCVYFGLVTPIGILFRLLGRDALERRIDRSADSYWRKKESPRAPSSYLRRW